MFVTDTGERSSAPAQMTTGLRIFAFSVLLMMVSGCSGMIEYIPTPTPTVFVAPLDATPTIDIHPPTPIPNDFNNLDFAGVNNPTAAANPALSPLIPGTLVAEQERPQIVSVPVAGNVALAGEIHFAVSGAPGIVLIGVPSDDWSGFPTLLREAGYTVMVVTARIPALEGDFTSILDTFQALGLISGNIGVVGSTQAADMAFAGCAVDSRCTTAVLLSPRREGATVPWMVDYNPRPLMMVVSRLDTDSLQTVEALRTQAEGDLLVQPFDDAGIGTQMLARRNDLRDLIITWINRHVGLQ